MVLRRSDAVANQSRVLEAAREVFADQGLSAEVKDIADRAGVGVATIYRGFGSKDGLVQATIDQADDALAELVGRAEAAPDPTEGVRLLVRGMLTYAQSYGWLIQALLAGSNVRRSEASLQRRDSDRRRLMDVIGRAVESGAIRPELTKDLIKLFLDGAVIMVTFRTMRREVHPPIDAITDSFVLMLKGPPVLQGSP